MLPEMVLSRTLMGEVENLMQGDCFVVARIYQLFVRGRVESIYSLEHISYTMKGPAAECLASFERNARR